MTTLGSDRVGVVTGGASGIGAATVRALVAAGVGTVVVADRDRKRGRQVVEELATSDARVSFAELDVTDAASVDATIGAVGEEHGRLDLAVNCAGVTGAFASIVDCELDSWRSVLDTNLVGTFLCLRAELRLMVRAGRGAIVNVASGAGRTGFPGLSAYVASKHGVVGLTRAAALEAIGSGVRVNAVCPGSTATPMLADFLAGDAALERRLARASPAGRLARPEEIAAAIVWLCSDGASFVVGQALPVDGGAVLA